MPYLRLLRPHQWVKNVFVFAGVVFGGPQIIERGDSLTGAIGLVLLGFACLSLVSSSVYIFNDIRDREEDRLHPRKRNRPLAAGLVSVPAAGLLCVTTGAIGLFGGFLLDRAFFLMLAAYLVLQGAYTLGLKRAVLLDVIIIATGFVLRAVAGAVLVHVQISIWLVLCTFTLCLFMGFSKRRCELNAMSTAGPDAARRHRATLLRYSPDLLNHMTTVAAGIAVISFMLYATDRITIEKFGTPYLAYTLPLVVYAVFRFALLVDEERVDGPTDVMLRDWPFQLAIVLWGIAALVIIYWGPELQRAIWTWANHAPQ